MLTPEQVTQFRTSAGLSPTPPAPTSSATPDIISQRMASLGMNTSSTTPTTTSTPSSVDNPQNLGDFTGQAQKEGISKITSSIQGGADKYSAGVDKMNNSTNFVDKLKGLGTATGGLLESGLGSASGALSTIFAPVTGAVNDVADKLSNIPALQHLATGSAGDALQKVQDSISETAKTHPELATNISDGLNVFLAALGEGSATAGEGSLIDSANKSITANTPDVVGGIKTGITDATNAVKTGVDTAKTVAGNVTDTISNKASDITGGLKDKVGNIKERISPTLTPEEQVGKIIQGKTSDIPAAQRTFASLGNDVNPAKMDIGDLSDAIQNKIQENLNKVDTHFANDTTPHQMSEFEQTTGKGNSAVKSNYVQQAIDQLKDFYTKTNDAQGLSDIKALEEKANTEGLSSKELNDLAKEHGSTIKAFNANGEAASGLTKQAAENTRMGLKTTAREMLAKSDPEAAKIVTKLDKGTSDAIHTKNLLDKQIEKEAINVQKNGKPGALQQWIKDNPIKAKIAGFIGADKIIKSITGGRLGF